MDLGETDGVPIPSPNVNDVASVPLVVNAGSQRLAAAQLTITYSSAVLDVGGSERKFRVARDTATHRQSWCSDYHSFRW